MVEIILMKMVMKKTRNKGCSWAPNPDRHIGWFIEKNPDDMGFIQRICWLVVVWCEYHKRKIRKLDS